ncbi:YheU family protein [Shewanella yunxiaonensis]|uniref:YheU family protein n=1 Tax=Shewanella yunxiaonensis TaxID=2829809 RepID=A0ABX7YRB2_9GAMM|nr:MULTISPECIES: YheU family protein [Shewanella]MDF0535529.1 YheU family protein [Shewanella sp. A32]QUN05304.1 YheU family protein [Shewanella yunxiaonensis]
MLIPYESLLRLPTSTVDNLIREYLLSQVEDGSFNELNDKAIQAATEKCRQALKKGELIVEYSEDDESVAIRSREQIIQRTPLSED